MQETSSLFITDPLNELNPKKDTTILWMQEVYDMGGQILQCEMKDLIYKNQQTFADFSEIQDPNHLAGKIISIDNYDKSFELVSLGHRNHQGLFYFNDKLYHPSFITLIPVIGVSFVILFSNKDTLTNKILSSKLKKRFIINNFGLFNITKPIINLNKNFIVSPMICFESIFDYSRINNNICII